MKVTVESLEALYAKSIISLHRYDTVKLQYWKRLLVDVLSQYPNKEHDHEHAYLLEDKMSSQKESGCATADLCTVPTRPDKHDTTIPFWQYQFYLDIYNTHIDINQAAVSFLKKLCPSGFVGLEVGYNQLPKYLMVGKA